MNSIYPWTVETTRRDKPYLSSEANAMSDWSNEETDGPLYADDRNFYKVELWTMDQRRVAHALCRLISIRRAPSSQLNEDSTARPHNHSAAHVGAGPVAAARQLRRRRVKSVTWGLSQIR